MNCQSLNYLVEDIDINDVYREMPADELLSLYVHYTTIVTKSVGDTHVNDMIVTQEDLDRWNGSIVGIRAAIVARMN